MESGQLRELLIIIAILTLLLGSIVYLGFNLWKGYRKKAVFKFKKYFSELTDNPSEYKIYTTGHPYTWTEISFNEAVRRIESDCLTSLAGGWPIPKSAKYLLKVDISKKSVYLVITHKKYFNWEKLVHYDEWVQSNERGAEGIGSTSNS